MFVPSNDELTSDVDSRNLGIKFLNFEKCNDKLNDFTLLTTFNLTLLSNEELDKLVSRIPE